MIFRGVQINHQAVNYPSFPRFLDDPKERRHPQEDRTLMCHYFKLDLLFSIVFVADFLGGSILYNILCYMVTCMYITH